MSAKDHDRLHRRLDRLEAVLPGGVSRCIRRLRAPEARWYRLPLAILFILGGLLWFLPVLGLWMLPVGLLLLALDLASLRRPVGRAMVRGEWGWRRWQRRRKPPQRKRRRPF